MGDKTFYRILTAVVAIGVLTTAALVVYTFYLHSNCSIISYIGNKG